MLRESLLSSVAVDIGGEGAERKKAQSWLKLCVLALAYVWPDTIGLKARTLVCVVLIVLMRGLNLMVTAPTPSPRPQLTSRPPHPPKRPPAAAGPHVP